MKRLFFLHMPGCPACAKMKPVMKKLAEVRKDVVVMPIDLTKATDWPLDWSPTATPTLLIVDRYGARPRAAEGYAPLSRVMDWIDQKWTQVQKGTP
jgi:thiol-disulfide isomerase/thioredoxin